MVYGSERTGNSGLIEAQRKRSAEQRAKVEARRRAKKDAEERLDGNPKKRTRDDAEAVSSEKMRMAHGDGFFFQNTCGYLIPLNS